jgi:hypothetical protein
MSINKISGSIKGDSPI